MLQMPPAMSRPNTINATNFRGLICTTCLSSDRVLYPLQISPQLLNICNGFTLDLQDKICWECKALLTKMFKFRHKALQSRAVLACLLTLNQASISGQQGILIQSLTTLSNTQNFSYEVGNNSPQQQVKIEVEQEYIEVEQEYIDVVPKVEPEIVFLNKAPPISPIKSEPVRASSPESDNACDVTAPLDRDDLDGLTLKTMGEENMLEFREKAPPISPIKSEPVRASSPESDNACDVTAPLDRDDLDGLTLKTMGEENMLEFREKERQGRRYKNCKFRCETCIQCFRSNNFLNKHNQLLHSESNGPFTCRVCEQRFLYDGALQIHLKIHYKFYECQDCSFLHQRLNRMYQHRREKHDTRPRACYRCGESFNSLRLLRYHLLSAHDAKPRCEVCGKEYSQRDRLRRHMLEHTTGVPMMQCTVCHKQYRGEWGLKAHMRTHTDTVEEDAYCPECDIKFKSVYLYRNHLKRNKKHVDPDMCKPYKRYRLARPKNTVLTTGPHGRPLYWSKSTFGKRKTPYYCPHRFECADCGKKFLVKSNLRAHIENVHLQLKNYCCDVCDAKFYLRATLNKHKLDKHSGRAKSRHHVCHICGKAFFAKKVLEQHTNSHLGVRPYKCTTCGDTFTYGGALFTHNKLVHLKQHRANAHADSRSKTE